MARPADHRDDDWPDITPETPLQSYMVTLEERNKTNLVFDEEQGIMIYHHREPGGPEAVFVQEDGTVFHCPPGFPDTMISFLGNGTQILHSDMKGCHRQLVSRGSVYIYYPNGRRIMIRPMKKCIRLQHDKYTFGKKTKPEPEGHIELPFQYLCLNEDGIQSENAEHEIYPELAANCCDFGIRYCFRFLKTGSPTTLQQAVDQLRRLAYLEDRLQFRGRLHNCSFLLSKIWQTGTHRAAFPPNPYYLYPEALFDHSRQLAITSGLAILERVGAMDLAIREALQVVEAATMTIEVVPVDVDAAKHYSTSLRHLAAEVMQAYDSTLGTDEAMRCMEQHIETILSTDPKRPDFLKVISEQLFERWNGEPTSLQEIQLMNKAASTARHHATPELHDFDRICNALAASHRILYDAEGYTIDLDGHYKYSKEALESLEPGDPISFYYLKELASACKRRFDRRSEMRDLDDCINLLSQAEGKAHNAHRINEARYLKADAMFRKAEHRRSAEEMDHAIDLLEIAEESCDCGRCPSFKLERLFLLGKVYHRRAMIGKSDEDLTRAINIFANINGQTENPQLIIEHEYASALSTKIFSLSKFGQNNEEELMRALSIFIKCSKSLTLPPAMRATVLYKAAFLCTIHQNWPLVVRLIEDSQALLPKIALRSLSPLDLYRQISSAVPRDRASLAASAAINAGKSPEDVLRLVEIERDIVAGMLMETRTDISDLKISRPRLARRFVAATNVLDSPQGYVPSSTYDASSSDGQDFQQLLSSIRSRPDFKDFLRLNDKASLMSAANEGPLIMINTDAWRSDAFLIEKDNIRILPLPDLICMEVDRRARKLIEELRSNADLTSLLEWLWDCICRPCLDALGFTQPETGNQWPRVWWIPIGTLRHFPFHAAGYHTPGSRETVMDRVISSYSTSIKTLLQTRNIRPEEPNKSTKDKAVLLSMQHTIGQDDLRFAQEEVSIAKTSCGSLCLETVSPESLKRHVLDCLKPGKCRIFHFAGHSHHDPRNPLDSHLLLHDWQSDPLKVSDLLACRLQEDQPFLAYLSSCSSGANDLDEGEENMHLCSAFQLAGFRNVIGTLWKVYDPVCLAVAQTVYHTMEEEGMTDIAVSRGLHFAARELRAKAYAAGRWREGIDAGKTIFDQDGVIVSQQGGEICSELKGKGYRDFPWIAFVHYGP